MFRQHAVKLWPLAPVGALTGKCASTKRALDSSRWALPTFTKAAPATQVRAFVLSSPPIFGDTARLYLCLGSKANARLLSSRAARNSIAAAALRRMPKAMENSEHTSEVAQNNEGRTGNDHARQTARRLVTVHDLARVEWLAACERCRGVAMHQCASIDASCFNVPSLMHDASMCIQEASVVAHTQTRSQRRYGRGR